MLKTSSGNAARASFKASSPQFVLKVNFLLLRPRKNCFSTFGGLRVRGARGDFGGGGGVRAVAALVQIGWGSSGVGITAGIAVIRVAPVETSIAVEDAVENRGLYRVFVSRLFSGVLDTIAPPLRGREAR